MKQIHFIAVIAILLGVISTSCKKATHLKIDKENICFTIKGGTDTVHVSCDAAIEVKEQPEWANVKLEDSTLVVSVTANDSKDKRLGTITLESGDFTAKISLAQTYVATHLSVAEQEVTIPKEGGSHEVTVDCDGDVTVQAPDFVTATYAGGKLQLKCAANNEGTKQDTVTLTADKFTASLAITLEGLKCTTCNGTGKVTCSKCKGKGHWIEKDYIDADFTIIFDYGCTKCGGRGCMDSVEGDFYSPFRKGSGKVTCPTCKGKGY